MTTAPLARLSARFDSAFAWRSVNSSNSVVVIGVIDIGLYLLANDLFNILEIVDFIRVTERIGHSFGSRASGSTNTVNVVLIKSW